MSDPVSALGGKTAEGFARVSEAGLTGMVTIRADLGGKALAKALKGLGLPVPDQRRIEGAGGRRIAWMSPDELLLICDYAEAPDLAAQLGAALVKEHALVVDVSDARALMRVNGSKADQVLSKLCPVDFALLPDGEIRRTRAAQAAVALWRSDQAEISLICFRSVAGYVFDLLEVSARKGGELS